MTGIAHHNRVLKRARLRALELEPKLAGLLVPILDRAGTEAARAFQAKSTNFLTAGLVASAPTPMSAMVAVKMRPDEAAAIAQPGGEDPETLHVTLAFLGEVDDATLASAVETLGLVAARHAPLVGSVGGIGAFAAGENGTPSILLPDVPGLAELRHAVVEALNSAGIDYSREHGHLPHVSIAYLPEGAIPSGTASLGQPLHFDHLVVARGDVPTALPLIGAPPVTASASPGQPPQWASPAPDELIDVAALVATLRTKTDPVRLAVVETMMTEALAGVGIAFDATNPFVAKVLAQSGSQITHIAQTTQENVMKIIRESYEQGLSIPDTAAAIRAGMQAASIERATLIARTELAGTVNGGSLAATQIFAGATGDAYQKSWMTAPGAPHPRHEDYEGLDGQTVNLDEYFDVGGLSLMYPGDPDGDVGEVANCRCALQYVTAGGEATGIDVSAEE